MPTVLCMSNAQSVAMSLAFTSACKQNKHYCIEENFDGCKLWRINYKNTCGGINFGKFECFNVI